MPTPSSSTSSAPTQSESLSTYTRPHDSDSADNHRANSNSNYDGSTNCNGSPMECKRPKYHNAHSHSSRQVHLTDEITPREMVLSIIQAQYHIYHTDLSGYLAGGAMVQDALTKYALGGSPKDLFQAYRRFRPDKERIPPVPTIIITTSNWRDWLGHKSYYHDYLDFFDQELRQLEAKTLKETTVSSPSLSCSWSSTPSTPLAASMAHIVSEYMTPLIPGLCGATGPLIHLGYGIEFGSRLATAEGLAYACVSYQPATTCFISSTEGVSSWQGQQGSSSNGLKRSPTVSILNMIRNDKRLDGMFDAGFQAKLNVVMSSRVSLLKSYLGMWVNQIHSVSEALLDLSQTSSLLLFTATNRFGDEQQLDKKLANIMLATHAARFLVKVLPSEQEQEQLLMAIWMSLVATYVVQGRPRLMSRAASTHPIMTETSPVECHHASSMEEQHDGTRRSCMATSYFDSVIPNVPQGRWRGLAMEAVHAEHQLISKIIRSLWWAEQEHGECSGIFFGTAVRALGEDPTSDESTGPGF
ncbi:hypothetical protein BG011_002146 [Mortierella polycephala]|uniref:Uncharacterized protein n=1 Tax=Mortierella polycephala TaxID=41804 RepID=A0A9P6Q3V6_9FUNG|nr:hypothetical protein BG011_002146 [Mortierella polycephala]